MYNDIIRFIRNIYQTEDFIPLHEPRFIGNEKKYLEECIDSTFVSSVGKFVDRFEEITAEYTGAKKAVVCVNGTEALHMALMLSGVNQGDEVITQPLTFIATVNAISYTGAKPVFVDVDLETMGLSPASLKNFLEEYGEMRNNGFCYNKKTNNKISACIPMHTFGHPCKIDEIAIICEKYNIALIEDAAESIGSKYKGKHTGTFGKFGILSYNGNKIITTGGGGMILTNDELLGKLAKHLTTQAKIPHLWEYAHDHIGYNYRMPNLNAALGVAQMENLDKYIKIKRDLALSYKTFFTKNNISFFSEPENAFSNYWLNAIILKDKVERDAFLEYTNNNKVMTRPAWRLMYKLPMFKDCLTYEIKNSEWLEDRLVNIPSSVIIPT
jgi:aminotransferase in exopolysaccharide biosynthesis